MKSRKAIIVPAGIIILPERENEENVLLCNLDFVGMHASPCSGYVQFRELHGPVVTIQGKPNKGTGMLKCGACNRILVTFPIEIATYGQLRHYFDQLAGNYL